MIPLIPTRIHAVLDYLVGALLILLPLAWLDDYPVAAYVPMILGAGTIVYSLITRYEYSAAKLIPMPVHLGIDAVAGIFLAISPWLFGFADDIWAPHVVVGLLELGVTALSRRIPDDARLRPAGAHPDRGTVATAR